MNRLPLLLVCWLWGVGSLHSADLLLWTFDKDFESWQASNWESVSVTDGAIQGVTKYDPQLISPKLDILAEDYGELWVRVQSDLAAPGEVFVAGPDRGFVDRLKVRHRLPASTNYVIHRILLVGAEAWTGRIGRIRFDPLNPPGARMRIDLIALVPRSNGVLLNGGAEILENGNPLDWRKGGKAELSTSGPYSGKNGLRMADGGWWETASIDLSFLNVLHTSFHWRSRPGSTLDVEFLTFDVDGKLLGVSRERVVAEKEDWQEARRSFSPPRKAAWVRIRFTAAKRAIELDEVRVKYGERGFITEKPKPQPAWDAQWIWHPDTINQDHQHVYFQQRFDLPAGKVRFARIRITADDAYALAINGKELARTFGDIDGWRTPEVLDFASALKPGENVFTVDAADVTSAQGLIAEGVVVFADGRELRLRTDRNWQVSLRPGGPWGHAYELGAPPSLPWGYLPDVPLGIPGRVAVLLTASPKVLRPPALLDCAVTITADSDLRKPVFVHLFLEQEGRVLREEWGTRPFFQKPAATGSTETLDGWRIPVPFGARPGRLTLRVEVAGAACPDGARPAGIEVVSAAPARGFPAAEVRVAQGLPRLFINGKETNPTQALFNRPDPLHQANARKAGIRIWGITLGDAGFKENGFDYAEVDQLIEDYLASDPDVWLIPNILFDTRYQRWWIRAHPEARCRLENGSDQVAAYKGVRNLFPSTSSSVWRDAYAELLRKLIRHLIKSPYAGRIVGFQPNAGITAEWFHWGSQSGELVDYSEAGQADFRVWLKRKYGSDKALQAAWRRPDVALETARVPSDAERRRPLHGMFYDPATQQTVLDYHQYQHEVVAQTVTALYRVIREETGGRTLCGTYYGYVMHLPEDQGFGQGSGHFDLQRILSCPDTDYGIAPTGYAWRHIGEAPASMTAVASFALHGKLWWDQADLRSHWSTQDYGRPPDLQGSIQAMRREVARSLAQGNALQWYDFSNGWTFGDKRLAEEVGRLQKIIDMRQSARDWPRSKYLAVIVDEMQVGTCDVFRPPYAQSLIYRQREQLNRSGVPWRAYLFSDLMKRPELLEHRAFLLLNLFRLTGAQRAFLENRLLAGGRTVAFIGPVGLMDETGFSAGHSSEVLGWTMQEEAKPAPLRTKMKSNLPGPWRECSGLEFGNPQPWSPLPSPVEPRGLVLGHLKVGGRPSVVFERRNKTSVLWSASPGFPPSLIRCLARVAGLPVVTSASPAIYIGHGFIGIHATAPGPVSLDMVEPCAVSNLVTGKRWPPGTRKVEMNLERGETAILFCGELSSE